MFALEPVVHLKTGAVLYREALWRPLGKNHPVGPMLQAVNSLGLMKTLDFAMAAEVRDFVLNSQIDSRIGLNLEPQTVIEHGDGILCLLGSALRGIVIEITERGDPAFLADAAFRRFLERSCETGALVALDDLGEGLYADYAQVISEFRPAFIKADKARIEVLTHAKSFGASCIAEKIETQKDLAAAIDAGAQYGQGYLFTEKEREASRDLRGFCAALV